jgi:heparosan-N-sulfate-glucuronate 5-epimerase
MVRWAALVLVSVLLVVPVAARGYERTGEYLWFTDLKILGDSGYVRIYLEGGVPIVDYGTHRSRNPVTIAQYGLSRFGTYRRSGDRAAREDALRSARWLVHHQHGDGTWRYDFPYRVGTLPELAAGWSSALAQGQGISLLVRAHATTRNAAYLTAALRAIQPLTVRVAKGGLQTRFDGGLWLEEYPTRPRHSFVLNGFMFTLLGLYDLAPRSPTALALYRAGRRTLIRVLPLYDAGGGCSLYAQVPDPQGRPWRISNVYKPIHVGLLRTLDALQHAPVLREYAARWLPGCP